LSNSLDLLRAQGRCAASARLISGAVISGGNRAVERIKSVEYETVPANARAIGCRQANGREKLGGSEILGWACQKNAAAAGRPAPFSQIFILLADSRRTTKSHGCSRRRTLVFRWEVPTNRCKRTTAGSASHAIAATIYPTYPTSKIRSTFPRSTRRPSSTACSSLQPRSPTTRSASTFARIRLYIANFGSTNSSL